MTVAEWETLAPPVKIGRNSGTSFPFHRGDMLKTDDGRELLVGDVNTSGGVCDDCTEDAVIIAVRRAMS